MRREDADSTRPDSDQTQKQALKHLFINNSHTKNRADFVFIDDATELYMKEKKIPSK